MIAYLKPLPKTVFEGLSQGTAALQFLQRAQHIASMASDVAEAACNPAVLQFLYQQQRRYRSTMEQELRGWLGIEGSSGLYAPWQHVVGIGDWLPQFAAHKGAPYQALQRCLAHMAPYVTAVTLREWYTSKRGLGTVAGQGRDNAVAALNADGDELHELRVIVPPQPGDPDYDRQCQRHNAQLHVLEVLWLKRHDQNGTHKAVRDARGAPATVTVAAGAQLGHGRQSSARSLRAIQQRRAACNAQRRGVTGVEQSAPQSDQAGRVDAEPVRRGRAARRGGRGRGGRPRARRRGPNRGRSQADVADTAVAPVHVVPAAAATATAATPAPTFAAATATATTTTPTIAAAAATASTPRAAAAPTAKVPPRRHQRRDRRKRRQHRAYKAARKQLEKQQRVTAFVQRARDVAQQLGQQQQSHTSAVLRDDVGERISNFDSATATTPSTPSTPSDSSNSTTPSALPSRAPRSTESESRRLLRMRAAAEPSLPSAFSSSSSSRPQQPHPRRVFVNRDSCAALNMLYLLLAHLCGYARPVAFQQHDDDRR